MPISDQLWVIGPYRRCRVLTNIPHRRNFANPIADAHERSVWAVNTHTAIMHKFAEF
jgi:hypothetical protein